MRAFIAFEDGEVVVRAVMRFDNGDVGDHEERLSADDTWGAWSYEALKALGEGEFELDPFVVEPPPA